MSRLAVVIPLYNHRAYIARAIRSALDQDPAPDRVIVVDDGSSDGSADAVLAMGEARVELHRQENAGAHVALNRAIARAAGHEFVAILNSDDFYLPGRFARCLGALAADAHLGFVCTGLRLVGPDDAALPAAEPRARWFRAVWEMAAAELPLPEKLGMANFPATTSNFVGRAEWFRAHPFRPYRYAHDYYALALAAIEGRLAILPEVLLAYRVHPANTINTRPRPLTEEMLRVNVDLCRELAPRLAGEPALRERFAQYQRGTWSNVSAHRRDVLETLLAQALADVAPDRLEAWLAGLAGFGELDEFPNRALANAAGEAGPMHLAGGVAARNAELRAKLDKARAQLDALREQIGRSLPLKLAAAAGSRAARALRAQARR